MGAGHAHALYVHGHSRVHRLAPEAKIVATVVFVAAVAVTPREQVWAFGIDAAALAAVAALARLRPGFLLARLTAITPFVLFALLLPFVAGGEETTVLGIGVSREGLWGAWNVLAKAGVGASATIVLVATTEIPDLLRGLDRLRVPSVVTAIASFMIRYLEVVAGELGRMRTSMTARGYDPRWVWQVRPMAASAGALFVRSYERGERIAHAMAARGYTGTMPRIDERSAGPRDWAAALLLPVAGAATASAALLV